MPVLHFGLTELRTEESFEKRYIIQTPKLKRPSSITSYSHYFTPFLESVFVDHNQIGLQLKLNPPRRRILDPSIAMFNSLNNSGIGLLVTSRNNDDNDDHNNDEVEWDECKGNDCTC